jgi:hypothetical protein
MLKRSIVFYLLSILCTVLFFSYKSHDYLITYWYIANVVGNSIIIYQAIKTNVQHKKLLIAISSLLILSPLLFLLLVVYLLNGITC